MLMSLGPVVFDLVVNLTETSSSEQTSVAKHDVVNAPPTYELMGDEESTFTLSGVIHPEHFGGLSGISALKAARAAQTPLPLMRGDFRPLGWVIIDTIETQEEHLNSRGVGRRITFTVDLIAVGTPGSGLAGAILRLF